MVPIRPVIAIPLMVLNLILIGFIVSVTLNEFLNRETNLLFDKELCVKISCKPGENCCDEKSTNTTRNNTTYCCYRDGEKVISEIMKMKLTESHTKAEKSEQNLKQIKEVAYKLNNKSNVKTSAHLQMDVTATYDKNTSKPLIKWTSSGERSFVKGAAAVVADGIQVKHAAYYFIYSNVLFHANQVRELEYARLCHSIEKLPNYEVLYRNPQTTCKVRRRYQEGFVTSYIGAVYYLKANDTVVVRTSVVNRILRDPETTYFGLYML